MIEKYYPIIKQMPVQDSYNKSDLLRDDLLIYQHNKLTVYYAPFDYINTQAKVMFLGITPGFAQMQKAYQTVISHMQTETITDCLQLVKKEASFSGPLRKNLVNMLDEIGLNDYLNIKSTVACFSDRNDLVHNTSILRYPVFYNQLNYSGSQPSLLKTPYLKQMIDELFLKELALLDDKIIIVPMGKAIQEALNDLQLAGFIKNQVILSDFPHPSGANGGRLRQFQANKSKLKNIILTLK
jgi:hypothetical protein